MKLIIFFLNLGLIVSIVCSCSTTNNNTNNGKNRYKYKTDRAPKLTQTLKIDNIKDAKVTATKKSKFGNKKYTVFNKSYEVLDTHIGFTETGVASWYGEKFHGHSTSNGEIYDMYSMSAAHKHLPIPCYVKVTNLENNKSTIVRVNDRGPFHKNRIIDLSYAAAIKLGVIKTGTSKVKIEAINYNDKKNLENYRATLQIGAFKDLENAKNLQKNITKVLKNSESIKIISNKNTHKVHIGPITNYKNVASIKEKLKSADIRNIHIITE